MGSWYCTVEDVRDALESKASAYDEARIGRVIEAASRDVDDITTRDEGGFRPLVTTRYFDWPPDQSARYYRLWLDGTSLISATEVTSGGVTIASTDYFLEPQQYGPPYNRIEIDRASSAAFSEALGTPQRAVSITGLWGYRDDRTTAGVLDGGISSGAASLTASNGATVGVGDHLVIDDERVIVTAKGWADTGQNTGGALTASMADNAVAVSNGTEYSADEVLMIGTERMRVLDVVANTLVVKRAWDGSVLAAHGSGADIYARRLCYVTRAAQGTAAAGHSDGVTISRHDVPGDVRELTLASAATSLLLGRSAYARETGGGGAGVKPGEGLPELRERVIGNHGRQMRQLAV